jgi:nitrite reductase/ring-hydroxylating ferredoxin subunit
MAVSEQRHIVDVGVASEVLHSGRAMIPAPDGGADILVLRTALGIFAVRAVCPHIGRSLADAQVRGRRLRCAGHGRRYDLRTGRQAGRQSGRPLTSIPAWVENGSLYLAIPAVAEVTTTASACV